MGGGVTWFIGGINIHKRSQSGEIKSDLDLSERFPESEGVVL